MQEKKTRRSNADRREQTIGRLLKAARDLFVEKGYAETGTPEIVKRAEVTRGALYHHFDDKLDLFRAVILAEASAVGEEIADNTSTDMEPLDAMIEGANAYFDAMASPGRAFLLLVEGPSVLGRREMQAIDDQTGGEELRLGVQFLSDRHDLSLPVRETAVLLSALFDRASLAISEGEDASPYRDAMNRLVRGLF